MFSAHWPSTTCRVLDILAGGTSYALSGAAGGEGPRPAGASLGTVAPPGLQSSLDRLCGGQRRHLDAERWRGVAYDLTLSFANPRGAGANRNQFALPGRGFAGGGL